METKVSIGQVKRDISELVNRVAYGGEQILLTSRGKPKAALVSIQDFERLRKLAAEQDLAQWTNWQHEVEILANEILTRRNGEDLDVDRLWDDAKSDLEARDDHLFDRG